MKKEFDDPLLRPIEDDDEAKLCPECEGRGRVRFKDKRDIEIWGKDELCMTCDGLGVVYD